MKCCSRRRGKRYRPDQNDGEQQGDMFYHGVVSKIFWSSENGVIHSDSGKEVPFIFAFVTLLEHHVRTSTF